MVSLGRIPHKSFDYSSFIDFISHSINTNSQPGCVQIAERETESKISNFAVRTILFIIFFFSLWGGGLLICEKILDEDKRGPKQALLQSLSMLVATGGKERTASEYKQILDKHGFIVTQINQLDQCPFMDVILCLKKWGSFSIWTGLFLRFVIEIDVYSFSKESDWETDWHPSSPNWIGNYTFFPRLFKRWMALSIR